MTDEILAEECSTPEKSGLRVMLHGVGEHKIKEKLGE